MFRLTRPSSGKNQLEEVTTLHVSRVSITMLLLHVVVFQKFVLAIPSFWN
jgi:hypothetical protein